MKNYITNPAYFRLKTLLALGVTQVHEFARTSVAALTTYRVILGRCLLAMRETKGFKKFGCSSEIHYATAKLGLGEGVARDCRKVARYLLELPELTLAAENGWIEWGKLREITPKATVETEVYWLKLAKDLNYKQIEKLANKTPKGGIPGDVFEEAERQTSELRCKLSDEVLAMLDQARRLYSAEQGEAVTTAQVLEYALASYVSNQPIDQSSLEKLRQEMNRDLQAQKAREIPLVAVARGVAAEMGFIPIPEIWETSRAEGGESLGEATVSRGGNGVVPSEAETVTRAGNLDGNSENETNSRASTGEPSGKEAVSSASHEERETEGFLRSSGERRLDHPQHLTAKADSVYVEALAQGLGSALCRNPEFPDRPFGNAPGLKSESTHPLAQALGATPSPELFPVPSDKIARAGQTTQLAGLAHPLAQALGAAPNLEALPAPSGERARAGQKDQPADLAKPSAYSHPNGVELLKLNDPAQAEALLQQSQLLAVSSKRVCFNPLNRHTTKAQKREVLRRDGWCCATPGCPHRIFLHLHHLIPFSQGGPTIDKALLGLCTACHCNVHAGLLRIFQQPDGSLLFTDADGNSLAKQADLELGRWLDFNIGWEGDEDDSFGWRAFRGEWSAYGNHLRATG